MSCYMCNRVKDFPADFPHKGQLVVMWATGYVRGALTQDLNAPCPKLCAECRAGYEFIRSAILEAEGIQAEVSP